MQAEKFRYPSADSCFRDLDRKYFGVLNSGISMILLWLAEALLPADPLTLLAELKIYSPQLRVTELSLIRPVRKLVKEFKSLVNPLRQYSTERRTLEAVASILGSQFFSLVVDADSSSSEGDSTGEYSTAEEEDEKHDESDGCSSSSTDDASPTNSDFGASRQALGTGNLCSVKPLLFSGLKTEITKRSHKQRLSTANKNRKLLRSGQSLIALTKYKFQTRILEDAVNYILSHVKVKGFDTARLTLSKPHGCFVIPWLQRTMPREALWQGYVKQRPRKDERMRRTNFRALVDSLSRNEVQQRTGIDYMAQEYGIDTFITASDVVHSMSKEGLLAENLNKGKFTRSDEERLIKYLAEIEQCRAFTMRWYTTHVNCTTAGDGFYQHGTWWGLSNSEGTDEAVKRSLSCTSGVTPMGKLKLFLGERTPSATALEPPTKHCKECTRFVMLLDALENQISAARSKV